MRLGRAREYAKIGLRETLFTLKTNAVLMTLFIAYVAVYFPFAIYNMTRLEPLATLPNEYKLQMILPMLPFYNFVVALLVSVITPAVIDEERTRHVFEYLMTYSRYTVGEFLLVKMLSGVVVGVLAIVPYTVAVYVIVNMLASISLLLLLWMILLLLFSVASLTLILSLVTLVLEPPSMPTQ